MSIRVKTVTTLPAKMDVLVNPVFKGEWGGVELTVPEKRGRAIFVAKVGLGDGKSLLEDKCEGMRRGMARVIQDARRHALHQVVIDLREVDNAAAKGRAACEGAELANYKFTDYLPKLKKEQAAKAVRELILVVTKEDERAVKAAVKEAQDVLAGVELARNLVNQPGSHMSPKHLVGTARDLLKNNEGVSVKVLDKKAAAKAGMNAFLAVAKGSSEEPYVIHLVYTPKQKAQKRVALVGKGVTFDSGGLSLKPAEGMEYMKCDMAGAASVLGLFSVIARLKLKVEVHGIIAACENMPSGTAYRPGDVLTAKNGKTIEVLNTDAEGRITLADSLGYALEQKPGAIIDLATLTGACVVGLGETVAGLWSSNDDLAEKIGVAGKTTGEQLARMPLPYELKATIASKVADVRNIATGRWAGAITAALFLREFVDETPWAHLDIAGPAWAERPLVPYNEMGGTGFGVRVLAEFLKRY